MITGALGLVVCGLVRDAGRRLQPKLWESWGGPPTTRRLRWHQADDPVGLEQVHSDIAYLTQQTLPTAEEEALDPVAADVRYRRAITSIRAKTRSRDQFPLVFAENVTYGFRRNSLGLRVPALIIAALTFAAGVVLVAAYPDGDLGQRLTRWTWPIAIAAILGVYWWFIVTPDWVKSAADDYADRLIEAVALLRSSQ